MYNNNKIRIFRIRIRIRSKVFQSKSKIENIASRGLYFNRSKVNYLLSLWGIELKIAIQKILIFRDVQLKKYDRRIMIKL